MENDWVVSITKPARENQYHHSSKSPIFRVPLPLRSINPAVFTPQMVAIGPYHRNLLNSEPQFREMEIYKVRAAQAIAQGMRDGAFDRLIEDTIKDEELIRGYYDKGLAEVALSDLSGEKLAKMLVLDAAFVVAILHSFFNENVDWYEKKCGKPPNGIPKFDSRFRPVYSRKFSWPVRKAIFADLLLVENQVPLFLVKKIIRMDARCRSDEDAGKLLEDFVAVLAHWILPFTKSAKDIACGIQGLGEHGKHLLDCVYTVVTYSETPRDPNEKPDLYPVEVPGTTRLHKAGVQLIGHDGSLTDLSFENTKLTIPKVHVGDDTERMFRNLLAYESTHLENRVDVLSYLHFMDYLIDTPEDVDLLVNEQIMTETIGSNKHVALMWNELCKNTVCVFSQRYSRAGKAAKEHCESKVQGLWAEFHREYLSRPWVTISVLAAAAVLVMTFLTMWYLILTYKIPSKHGEQVRL